MLRELEGCSYEEIAIITSIPIGTVSPRFAFAAGSFNWHLLTLSARRPPMSCDRADAVLHGYFDNELDALGAAEFERHLEQCSGCADALKALNSLRSSMNRSNLYKKAPDSLLPQVLVGLRSASRFLLSWLAGRGERLPSPLH